MNILHLALVLLGTIPQPPHALRDSVTEIELNSFYDDEARLVFDQAIFRDHDGSIIAWRLVKSPSQIPVRDWEGGGYVAMWMDGEQLRRVRCESVVRSWTQYDVELLEREILPTQLRRGLTETRRGK